MFEISKNYKTSRGDYESYESGVVAKFETEKEAIEWCKSNQYKLDDNEAWSIWDTINESGYIYSIQIKKDANIWDKKKKLGEDREF